MAAGRSRWTLWPAPSICSKWAPGIVSRQAPPDRAELLIGGSGEDQGRYIDRPEAFPQRFLRAGTGRTQARRQTLCGVPEAVDTQVGRRCQSGEQGIGQPFVDERLDTHRFDVRRQCCVGRSPGESLVGIIDPGGRPDEDQALDELRTGEGSVQRHASAHRVADVRPSAAVAHEMVGALPEVATQLPGAPVAGQVHAQHGGGGQPRGEQTGEGLPRRRGLGETVGEDDPSWFGHEPGQALLSAIALVAILRSTWA